MLTLGIDGGLAHTGFAVLDGADVVEAGVWRTARETRKKDLRAASDSLRRMRAQVAALRALLGRHPRLIVAGVEELTHLRNASAAVKYALAWGAMVTTLEASGLLVVAVPGSDVKAAFGLERTASKAAMIAHAKRAYAITWPKNRGSHEHLADAIAVALAARATDVAAAVASRVAR